MRGRSRFIDGKVFLAYLLLSLAIFGTIAILLYDLKNRLTPPIPSMNIVLNGVSLDDINEGSKKIKYPGNKIIYNDEDGKIELNDVELKGRGNASWQMEKKSYRIETNGKIDLMGLGRVKKWGLISNGIDDSLMRNDLAYYIARIVDENYKIRGDYVDLYVNERELGLYYLVKLVEIGKETLDLKNEHGVVIELDNAYCSDADRWEKSKIFGDCLSLKDSVAKDDDLLDVAWQQFMDSYNQYEKAIAAGDYDEAAKYMDMDSLAKYYLINEFASNPDMYVTSWYLYKNGEDDIIHSFLAWDFDAAFGNKNWGEWPDQFYLPTNTMARIKTLFDEKENHQDYSGMGCKYSIDNEIVSPVLCHAMDISEFKNDVDNVYTKKLAGERDNILNYVRNRAAYIRKSAIRNNELWSMGDFDEAVDYLIWWLKERFNYFDKNYLKIPFEVEVREL